ncbi:feline leukemia virus subgroup C receptor-related protein 1, partial [Striga asiatica]
SPKKLIISFSTGKSKNSSCSSDSDVSSASGLGLAGPTNEATPEEKVAGGLRPGESGLGFETGALPLGHVAGRREGLWPVGLGRGLVGLRVEAQFGELLLEVGVPENGMQLNDKLLFMRAKRASFNIICPTQPAAFPTTKEPCKMKRH